MNAGVILEIVKLVDAARADESNPFHKLFNEPNTVIDPKYGKKYILPVPEDYITTLGQLSDTGNNAKRLFAELYHEITMRNPELREIPTIGHEDRYNITMGTASRLQLRDINYFVTMSDFARPDWIERLCSIARRAYGPRRLNPNGYYEGVGFALTPETSIMILTDYCQNLNEMQSEAIAEIANDRALVLPFKLHSAIESKIDK